MLKCVIVIKLYIHSSFALGVSLGSCNFFLQDLLCLCWTRGRAFCEASLAVRSRQASFDHTGSRSVKGSASPVSEKAEKTGLFVCWLCRRKFDTSRLELTCSRVSFSNRTKTTGGTGEGRKRRNREEQICASLRTATSSITTPSISSS